MEETQSTATLTDTKYYFFLSSTTALAAMLSGCVTPPMGPTIPVMPGPNKSLQAFQRDVAFPQPERSPYDWEWDDLIAAIRENKPYNEVKRGAEASMVASMGRFARAKGDGVAELALAGLDPNPCSCRRPCRSGDRCVFACRQACV